MPLLTHWKKITESKYIMESDGQQVELEKVKSENKNLTFRDHITSKVNIANRNVGIIFRTFTYIDQEMFLNLYKSIIRHHLEYATPMWSTLYKKYKIIIENVQSRTIKLISTCKNLQYQERLRKVGLPTLEYRRERADMQNFTWDR